MSSHRITLPVLALLIASLSFGSPLIAGSRIERELSLEPGQAMVLDADNGRIEVVGTSRSGARIVITSKRDEIESLFDFEFTESDNGVRIEAEKKSRGLPSWFSWSKGANLVFEVEVPHQTRLNLDTSGGSITVESIHASSRLDTSGGAIRVAQIEGDWELDTSGGSIEVADARGDVNADTSGGAIRIEAVSGNVRADTSGGSIRIRSVRGDITADTSGGPIEITDAGGLVEADTSGGSITVEFAAGNASGGKLSTSGGGIRVRLDPAVGLEIDASTSGGSVTAEVPITVRGKVERGTLRGRLGSGGAELQLRTTGGSIRIDPL